MLWIWPLVRGSLISVCFCISLGVHMLTPNWVSWKSFSQGNHFINKEHMIALTPCCIFIQCFLAPRNQNCLAGLLTCLNWFLSKWFRAPIFIKEAPSDSLPLKVIVTNNGWISTTYELIFQIILNNSLSEASVIVSLNIQKSKLISGLWSGY